jgi:hypothetical protein
VSTDHCSASPSLVRSSFFWPRVGLALPLMGLKRRLVGGRWNLKG